MGATIEIYDQSGNIQLSNNILPVGTAVRTLVRQPDSTYEQNQRYYVTNIYDPQTKSWFYDLKYTPIQGLSTVDANGFEMPALMLQDGKIIEYSVGSADCYIIGQTVPVSTVKFALVNMAYQFPTPQASDYLQVYSPTGNLLWSSSSLSNAVQVLHRVFVPFGNYTLNTLPVVSYTVPADIDIDKVYVFPILNALGGRSGWMSGADVTFTFKRVGRTFYINSYYWVVVDGYQWHNSLDYPNDPLVNRHFEESIEVLVLYLAGT